MKTASRMRFGQWTPDLPPADVGRDLLRAKNMRPTARGYRPIRSLVDITSGGAGLAQRHRGSISGTDSSGSGFVFAGDATALYERDGAGDMIDKSQQPYVVGADHRWDFAKFGEWIFAATPNENLQAYKIGTSGTFVDVSSNAPRARHVAIIDNFLVAGNIYDPVEGPLPEAISWCARLNPFEWPVVGSPEAASVQSDRQRLEGEGGWVQDVVAGAEVGAIFQERAIWRLDYIGGPAAFGLNRSEQRHGMLVPHSAVAFERMVFFIAEDGFRVYDYTRSENIGKDRVNRHFLADLDDAFLDRVWTAKDPDETTIAVLYPGQGNVDGLPNKLIFWDYVLDRFTEGEIECEGLIENATAAVASLDAPDTPEDPDDLGDPDSPDSFDDRGTPLGASRLGGWSTTSTAADFSGPPLEGLIETGDTEPHPGARSFVSEVRPIVDGVDAEISVGSRGRRNEPIAFGPYAQQDEDGKCSMREDGRYLRLRVRLPAGWDNAVGVDLVARPSGRR